MRIHVFSLAALAALLPAPAAAAAGCEIGKLLEIPVTMSGQRPMATARFGDKDARFILDSGAFYSTLSRASAAEYGLKVDALPPNFRLRGIGGDTSAGAAMSTNFALGGVVLPKVSFIVGGSDTGTAGLLGQNILGLADVEYDLPHGVVRLMKTSGCNKVSLAYWAGDRPVTVLPLERQESGPFKPHTIATVLLNGKPVRAVFDTGAGRSLLSLAAARRLGVTPTSPGVVPAGMGSGLGSRQVASWLAPFDRIEIGGESIPRPKIHIGEMALGNADMLIGVDFFLTHRVFVSNAARSMYVTYEGGPMFGLTPKGARSSDGTKLDLTDKTAEPTDAEGYSRRGAVFASNGKLQQALADFDKATAMAPTEARYFHQRAMARLDNRQLLPALADLDRAIALQPADADARVARAALRIGGGDLDGAKDDMKAADAALAPSSNGRLTLAGLYDRVGMPEGALANYTAWLRDHPEDSKRAAALNGRCWARAQLDRELDQALSDCNAALRATPGRAAYLDSRALVRLRQGKLDDALDDYDAALRAAPRNAWSLYARSIAAKRAGRDAEATANRAAALAIDPRIGERAKRMKLE